jgi:hypothetical protein
MSSKGMPRSGINTETLGKSVLVSHDITTITSRWIYSNKDQP